MKANIEYVLKYVVSVEIRCQPIGAWNGIKSNTNSTSVGTVINVTCSEGLQFSDGKSTSLDSVVNGKDAIPYRMSVCDKNGFWVPSLPSCIGQLSPHV
jgi:hypothetical protein